MSNCVHSTEFFFPSPQRTKRASVTGNEKDDGVYRQMRVRHGGQMRVKNIEIRHFAEINFQKKKYSRCVSDKWGVTSQMLLGPCQGSLSLLAMNLKAMDFDVKGCHIFSKIWTGGDSLSHTSLC